MINSSLWLMKNKCFLKQTFEGDQLHSKTWDYSCGRISRKIVHFHG